MEKVEKTITYKTLSGKSVIVKHVIQKENITDHNFMVDCDDIDVEVDGHGLVGFNGLSTRDYNGQTINVFQHLGNVTFIAPEVFAEIKEMCDAHTARFEKRINALSNHNYKPNKNLCPKCHTYCYGDCETN